MTRPPNAPPEHVNGSTSVEPMLRDHRPEPTGSLPRYANVWVLLGVVTVVILVLAFASRPTSPQPAPARATAGHNGIDPGAIDQYRRRLEEQERQLAEARRALAAQQSLGGFEEEPSGETTPAAQESERERLKYTSLFADSLAFSRRQGEAQPSSVDREERLAKLVTEALTAPHASDGSDAPGGQGPGERRTGATARAPERPASIGDGHQLPEGTIIETALMHRVDGELGGSVRCLVTAPVYAPRRDVVLIPAGSIVLGTAQAVTNGGQRRLAVAFHRIMRPDGTDIPLDRASAASQRGDQGISSNVDNHYWSTFGAAGAIGLVAGLAQTGTRYGAFDSAAGDVYRQGVSSSLANSGMRILDRYLNRLPTITVDEATPVKIVLMQDIQIPAYQSQP